MSLHRPKDINSLNDDFFKNTYSGESEKEEPSVQESAFENGELSKGDVFPDMSTPERKVQGEIDTILVENESDIKSGYVAEQLQKLAQTEFKNDDRIFHDFSDVDDNEEVLYNSFPEIDFDPSVFEDNELSDKEMKRAALKKAKEEAKAAVEKEKQIIKEQKELEKKVQKPFAKRRSVITVGTVFALIGVLCSILCFSFHYINSKGNLIEVGSLNIYYADGNNISSQNYTGRIVVTSPGKVQGSQNVLFSDNTSDFIGKIIAIGDGVYGIDMGNKVYRAEKDNIKGIVKFTSPDISLIYLIVTAFWQISMGVCLGFTLLTVLFTVLSARKVNKKIEELQEEYEII